MIRRVASLALAIAIASTLNFPFPLRQKKNKSEDEFPPVVLGAVGLAVPYVLKLPVLAVEDAFLDGHQFQGEPRA